MNPLTDLSTKVLRPDGSIVEVVRPGARLVPSKNWRLTEEAYRRYESHIREALRAWPQESKFNIPAGMSPNTFCHRLRDALQAVKLFGYDADVVEQLTSRPELCVSMDPAGTAVWIRARGQQGAPIKMHKGQSDSHPARHAPIVHPNLDADTLEAFCILLGKGIRSEPVQCKGQIPENIQLSLTSRFDIAFAYDENLDITTMI
jgi:hypothetical protein